MAPETFEMVEIDDPIVEAMLVSKQILRRLTVENIIKILKEKVFPYIRPGEVVKIDFRVRIHYDDIEGTLERQVKIKLPDSKIV